MILFWPSIPLTKRDRLPSKPGLYAVRWLFITWYVGKSVDLRNRWENHHRYPAGKAATLGNFSCNYPTGLRTALCTKTQSMRQKGD